MEKEDQLVAPLPVSSGLIQQVRQLSVPLWARILALALGLGIFMIGLWLLALGTFMCGADCNAGFKDAGTAILSATMIPVLVLVYLAFAETGTASLKRRTDEILGESIPQAFTIDEPPWASQDDDVCIRSCTVAARHGSGSPTARYDLKIQWGTAQAARPVAFSFFIDLNVYKVNVGLQLPDTGEFCGASGEELLNCVFGNTLSGAKHAGYEIPFRLPPAEPARSVAAGRYFSIVARRKMSNEFLWDPAEKLHFIFDLRNFVFAFASDWFNYCGEKESTPT